MATSKKFRFTLQDIIHHGSRYIKYWGIALQLFLLGVVLSLAYYTYGQPTYYSRSNAGFTNVTLPLKSETSDAQGRGRYAQVSFQVLTAFNSRWLLEQTAMHLGIVDKPGQYEEIRAKYIQNVRVGMLPGDILQIEVYAYQPWLVKAFPEAMIATYEIATVAARAKHRDSAYKAYTVEMKRLRERIMTEMEQRSKFEEDNQLIEQYIRNNSIEAVPSEMLTIKSRQETMRLVDDMLSKPDLLPIDKLSLLKKFSKSPVSVGSIVRASSVRDSLIAKSAGGGQTATVDLTSDAQRPVVSGAQGQIVVIPSMVEELEPWEHSERKLRSLLLEKSQASRKFLPGHETMRKIDKEIENLTDSINNELTTALNSFQLEKQQLQQRFEDLQKKMPDYRRVLNDFDRYKQEFNLMAGGNVSWESAYSNLQDRINAMEYTGIELKIDFDFQGFTMLRDDIPVSPNKSKLLQYGLLLGVGTAAAGCFVLEKLKSNTSIVSEVEELTATNSLGVVPLIPTEDLIRFNPIGEGGLSYFQTHSRAADLSETFRIVRASMPLYTQLENRLQVVMVTSARASEGKTTVSALTARSFAESGEKTLLIDADLRRGRVHRLIQGEQNAGLGGFLASQVDSIREVIVPSSIPNLDLITRGRESLPLYQNLSSDRVDLAISELRKTYDRIIIDTPPLLGLADSIMIGKHVDGAMLVIRSARTSQRDILTALDILKGTKVPIYGFVLNGVDLSKIENYYFYSSYYPKYYDPSYVGNTTA